MDANAGSRWRCVNPSCRSEITISEPLCPGSTHPVCSCGSPMKKVYHPPVFRYLEFLTLESSEPAHDIVPEK